MGKKTPPYFNARINTPFVGFFFLFSFCAGGHPKVTDNHKNFNDKTINNPFECFLGYFEKGWYGADAVVLLVGEGGKVSELIQGRALTADVGCRCNIFERKNR